MIDDSNCHCGPCTAMNEPLTLEGDIRYLKAHIETKNRQLAEKDNALAEAKLRIDIYREAWSDAERESVRLREENEKLKQRSTEQNDWLVRLQEENKKLREENERLNTHKARYQQEILQLEQEAETYRLALNKVRVITEEVGLE